MCVLPRRYHERPQPPCHGATVLQEAAAGRDSRGRQADHDPPGDRPRLPAGQDAFAHGVGWLAIERVDVLELSSLGDADARADGFASLREPRRVLRYPDHANDGKRWFRVSFTLTRLIERARESTADAHPRLFE